MTTVTRLEDLHLHRLQLFAYCSIGQTLLQKNLVQQTIECDLSTNPDPFIALSEILEQKKDQLKKLNNLFVNTSTKELIYKDYDRDELNPSINIFKLDISSLVELLTGIDSFKTSPKHIKGVKCKGQKENCSSHDVCCRFCELCLQCFLSNCEHHTVEKLVLYSEWTKDSVCAFLEIKVNINLMLSIRNATMHLTNEECVNLDSSNFQSSELPGINNWNDLKTITTKVLRSMAQFLFYSYITDIDLNLFEKNAEEIGEMVEKEELLKIFEKRIQVFVVFKRQLEIEENQDHCREQVQRLHLDTDRQSTLHIQFLFPGNVDYDLDCELALNISQLMKSRMKILFNDHLHLINNGLVSRDISNTKKLFYVQFNFEAVAPESNDLSAVYDESTSEKSIELWERLSEILQDVIPNLGKIARVFWQFGTIVINFALNKLYGSYWETEGIEKIANSLTVICSKLNEHYTDCLVFSCEVIPIKKTCDGLKTLSFEIVSDGWSDQNMKVSAKENLSRLGPFMGFNSEKFGKFLIF